ncbi:MAG: hypothetical protein ACKOBW_11210 [Planctomycetota bacterium]
MRKRCLCSAAIWTALSMAPLVSADEKAPAKTESGSSAQTTITVTVDSDGRVKINGLPENKNAKAGNSKSDSPKSGSSSSSSASSSAKAGKEKSNVGVESFSFGKMIVLGPDGKTEVQEFKGLDGTIPKEILEKLPAQVRKELEKKEAGKGEAGKGESVKGRAAKGAKLDKILQRLERVEKELAELKKAQDQ